MARVLSLDLGTSSVRAIAHDERGRPISEPVEVEWRPLRSEGGRLEFDVRRVAAAVDETVEQALRRQDVDAVGASPTVEEASARGAAILALERLGFEPAPATIERVYEPRLGRAEAFAEARRRDRDLYRMVVG